ncbi:single-stranded DNA-binding protein [Deinococcus sp.]|uniref:single-stranded DNA-binding protein n=1 Tax=Deinococcus sp. TaxID=47478 RepID=UPI003C7B25FB
MPDSVRPTTQQPAPPAGPAGRTGAVREALRASLRDWATVQVQADRALVQPAPDLDALYAGLEQALESGGQPADWAVRYAVDSVSPWVVRATLHLGPQEREGLGQGHTLHDARLLALADAMRAYGAIPASSEGQWVEYDADDGANIHDLEPHVAPGGEAPTPSLPPAPSDPQLERARTHIDDLLEELRGTGQGKAAALVLARRGYGNTLEESRAVYKELKALKG